MGFDRLAPFYRAMEMLGAGGKMQHCRLRFVGEIPVPRSVLIVGEGHGRFLPECVRRYPDARVTVVDSSQSMLTIARRKVRSTDRVEFVHADFLDLVEPLARHDLIVTHFFLDCFPEDELAEVVAKLGRMATPAAQWLLADFEVAPAGAARWRSRAIIAMLYRFFRSVTGIHATNLIPPDGFLETAGFFRHRRETLDWGLLKSEWWTRDPRTAHPQQKCDPLSRRLDSPALFTSRHQCPSRSAIQEFRCRVATPEPAGKTRRSPSPREKVVLL